MLLHNFYNLAGKGGFSPKSHPMDMLLMGEQWPRLIMAVLHRLLYRVISFEGGCSRRATGLLTKVVKLSSPSSSYTPISYCSLSPCKRQKSWIMPHQKGHNRYVMTHSQANNLSVCLCLSFCLRVCPSFNKHILLCDILFLYCRSSIFISFFCLDYIFARIKRSPRGYSDLVVLLCRGLLFAKYLIKWKCIGRIKLKN